MIFASNPGEEAIPLHLPLRKDHAPKAPAQVFPFEPQKKRQANWRAKAGTLLVTALYLGSVTLMALGVDHYLHLVK